MPCSRREQLALNLIRVALACGLGFWLGSLIEWADLHGVGFFVGLVVSMAAAIGADFALHVVFDKMIK